jgi:transposase-like protein
MTEKYCPRCGSKAVRPVDDFDVGSRTTGHYLSRVPQWHCNDCGYNGNIIEKDDTKPDPDMMEDIENLRQKFKEKGEDS